MSMLSNFFKVSKLTIAAFRTAERGRMDAVGLPLEVQFNPESLSRHYASVFQRTQGLGVNARRAGWIRSEPSSLSVELVFDETGVTTMPILQPWLRKSVSTRIAEFLAHCYTPESDTHEPLYLRLTWGEGPLGEGFDCRLESVDVNYTNFNRDGSPQRAVLSCRFVESLEPGKAAAQARLSSPDLTHRRLVKVGDTLPLLCIEIYGAAHHYLRVAQVNELDDFRELEPGTELIFPPFEQDHA